MSAALIASAPVLVVMLSESMMWMRCLPTCSAAKVAF